MALLPTGMDPSIHPDVFARDERGVLEIEHRVDDIRHFAYPTQGRKLRQLRMITLSVHRRVRPRFQRAPPPTRMVSPVIHEDSSDARNTAAAAISSGSPRRPSGVTEMHCLMLSSPRRPSASLPSLRV